MDRTCLRCGMRSAPGTVSCPKCDNRLDNQTDGSTVTVDIAHQGEMMHEALAKLDANLTQVRAGVAANLRLIVGGGLIREAVLARLMDYERRGDVLSVAPDPSNGGAVIVRIR